MSKKYRIIDKIRINQSIVKNKLKSPEERRRAYLELKRLNNLKNSGSIIKRPDFEMINVNPNNHKPFEHNYFVYNTDKSNYVQVNRITHSKVPNRIDVPSLYDGKNPSYVDLKIISKDRKNKKLKYYDFYESKLKLDDIDKNRIINKLNKKNYNN